MFIQKNFSFKGIMAFTGGHLIWLSVWVITVSFSYEFFNLQWLHIPWTPIAIIGTAVAFYIGFKNNQAYDRLWEARKIWGAIVNSSRAWGSTVKGFVSHQFSEDKKPLGPIHQTLIHRHISWLYILRRQLLIPTSWEHIQQHTLVAAATRKKMKRFGIGEKETEQIEKRIEDLLGGESYSAINQKKNSATQLIDLQSQHLKELREQGLIDDFRHMALQKIMTDFYVHQGKCERIKKFPLPRQYGAVSAIFVGIFIFLLPFGMVSEFSKVSDWGFLLSIPFSILIAWVYLVMELVGDYSENPFEGLGNDIPMYSLCRTIEIDLREMLGETDLPKGIEPHNGVLM
ncbi:MAG: putative membrane protein [Algoriphagus sp.]|jgi:putative membrane protein